jgi:hypothetical protein
MTILIVLQQILYVIQQNIDLKQYGIMFHILFPFRKMSSVSVNGFSGIQAYFKYML